MPGPNRTFTAVAALLAACLFLMPAAGPAADEGRKPLVAADILDMLEKGVEPSRIVETLDDVGLARPLSLEEVLSLKEAGAGSEIFAAINRASSAPPRPVRESRPLEGPLSAPDILWLLQEGTAESRLIETIWEHGMAAPLTLDEVIELRQAGATDPVFSAINTSMTVTLPPPMEPAEPEVKAPVVILAAPPPVSEDEILVTSVPARARVFISPAGTRRDEVFDHAYFAGLTPLSVSLDPGRYNIVVQKEAGEFERSVVPAWRTVHDLPDAVSALDNASLTFDPAHCCLPGSLDGLVQIRPMMKRSDTIYAGEAFGGFPPHVFDGESLQVLRVRDGAITQVMKLYHVRKNPRQARVLTATFIPASDDPLDPEHAGDLPLPGTFDPYFESDRLDYLEDDALAGEVGASLGIEPAVWQQALDMLHRAGKATIRQDRDGGQRLVTLALEGGGRLRVLDRVIRPEDPFSHGGPPPPAAEGAGQDPLPAMRRVVVPGLGLPRLVVENTRSEGRALILDDGQFFFVPAGSTREFVLDPGTHEARVASPSSDEPAMEGRLHFSYHARYSLTL